MPVTLLTKVNVSVEPSKTPPDPQGLLQAFSQGSRNVPFHAELPRADRALVAHAIARQYDIVTTDQRMKRNSFKEFVKRTGTNTRSETAALTDSADFCGAAWGVVLTGVARERS